jgi:predicted Zn-dependent protease
LLTVAIAHDFRGEFAAARPLLQDLRHRLPEHAIVAYHLGWASLGDGDAKAAAEAFADAAVRLPVAWTLLPRAIALFEAGRHDDLQRLLADLRADDGQEARALGYDVLRLLAAHALLQGDANGCRERLLATFTWLLQNPAVLAQRAGELAEQGALLVRLGGDPGLPALLATLQAQHPGSAVAEACAFVHGMWTVHGGQRLPDGLLEQLARGGDSPFAALLLAYAHERAGEVGDQLAALGRAAQLSSSPMTKALFARSLLRSGRTDEGQRLLQALRTELRTLALRQRCRHPLLGPELAFAASDAAP